MTNCELRTVFFNLVNEIIEKYKLNERAFHSKISKDNVYQNAVLDYREYFLNSFKIFLKPESNIKGLENIKELHNLCQKGKSCLILSRHLSNFDVPNFCFLMEKEKFIDVFNDIVFIAGRKLNEEASLIRFLTSMFPRIVIIPKNENIDNAAAINLAAQREIRKLKHKGKIILLYPTGTREREWDTESLKGIRETYNYVKSFDKVILMNILGNNLIPSQEGMLEDEMIQEKITIAFSKVYKTKELVKSLSHDIPHHTDKKQFIVDKIMDKIRSLK